MERTRRNFSPEQKVNILREHLIERVPVSDVCDKHQIQPTLFYQWQKTFFEKGTAAFEGGRSPSRGVGQSERKIEALEGKLRRKDEVIAEIRDAGVKLPIIASAGIRDYDDAREFFWAGADAVSLGSAVWLTRMPLYALGPLYGLRIRRLQGQVERYRPPQAIADAGPFKVSFKFLVPDYSKSAETAKKMDEVLNSANHRWYLNKMDSKEQEERKRRQEEFKKRYGQ